MDTQPSGILRPGHVRPSGERLKTLWLIWMALAEGMNRARVPKEGEATEPQHLPELLEVKKPAPLQLRLPGF
jgi:hypothetical protein